MNAVISKCKGKWYCGKWRTCARCAAIRAARIADRAEYLEKRHGRLALAIAKPESNTAKDIKTLRDKLLRAKLAPAGIWTVETGEMFAGLHLNLLIPAKNIISYEKRTEYVEIVRTSARAAAAYICKQSGMPSETQYAARLQGEWGSIVQHLMYSDDMQAAASQAAAINMALSAPRTIANYYKTDRELAELALKSQAEKKERTRDEYAAIMRRNLPALYASMQQTQN